jgi:hypothetical protein
VSCSHVLVEVIEDRCECIAALQFLRWSNVSCIASSASSW